MDSTFWFLLQYTVFYALVAIVFGGIGWWLRGPGRDTRTADLQMQLAEQQRLTLTAMDERDAALRERRDDSTHVSDAASLVEENLALENANIQLESDLSAARHELHAQSDTLANALAATAKLEAENAQLLAQSAAALTDSAHRNQRVEEELEGLKITHAAQIADLQRQLEETTLAATAKLEAENAQDAETQLEGLKSAHQAQIADLQRQLEEANLAATAKLEAENARLLAEATQTAQDAETQLESLKSAHAAQIADLQRQISETPSTIPTPAPAPATAKPVEPAKPKPAPKPKATKPKATAKSTAPATALSAPDKLAQIHLDLAPQLAVLAALTQERDDWQKRVHTLEQKTPPDLAGLALSRRSLDGSQERLTIAQNAAASLQNQQRALQKALAESAASSSTPGDDLTQIKGIKNVLSDQLHAHGIRTWRQIALWNDDDLHAFSELLAFKNRATRDHWRDQARQLHEATHGPLE